jgi:hypothetical protein
LTLLRKTEILVIDAFGLQDALSKEEKLVMDPGEGCWLILLDYKELTVERRNQLQEK